MSKESFARWLRNELRRREWSPAYFARRMAVSEGTVSHWLRAERLPRPESCEGIADALGLSDRVVLIEAGILHESERSPDDEFKDRLKALIDGIPGSMLGPVLPMLQGLYDDAQRTRMRVIEGRRVADDIRVAEERKRYTP